MQNDAFEPDTNHVTKNGAIPSAGETVYENVDHEKSVGGGKDGGATKPYAGMGKDDLLRFSQTPFWRRLRFACLVVFWFAWLGLLAAVIALTIVLPRCKPEPETDWWQTGSLYQVYLRSFKDSDGDGIGDIKGLTSELDYLSSLHVGAVVVSSFYAGQAGTAGDDFGYQLTNHTEVNPTYGSMEDFQTFLEEAHNRGIKVVVDFVPNYTGDQHAWFDASKNDQNIENPYWNYYVWRPCDDGKIPNNWKTVYGNSAWSRDAVRGQCYLHQFLPDQPELNMRSAAVQAEMEAILRFWLDAGVDGFRVNAPAFLYENTDLTDDPQIPMCTDTNPYNCMSHPNTRNLAEVHGILRRWNELVQAHDMDSPKLLLVDVLEDEATTLSYYSEYGQLPLYYGLHDLPPSCGGRCVHDKVTGWMDKVTMPLGIMWATGSQDLSRSDDARSRLSLMLAFTLPGTPLMYYGQEIGMTNGNMTDRTSVDPAGKQDANLSRDQYRSPMQWSSDSLAGFTSGSDTWLPVNDDFITVNVQVQQQEEESPLSFYKALSKMKTVEPAFYVGSFHKSYTDDDVFSFVREFNGHNSFLVAMNFGSSSTTVDLSGDRVPDKAAVYLSTDGSLSSGDHANLKQLTLQPDQAAILTWEYSR